MSVFAQDKFDELQYSKEECVFNLNAPSSVRSVKVRIYQSADAVKPVHVLKMRRNGLDRWRASLKGDWAGYFYTFDLGRGECPGTFAKAVGVNANRAAIVRMEDTDAEGWDKDVRPSM